MDRRRFEELFVRHAPDVRAYAQRRVPAGAVDDVVAETFAVLWRRGAELPAGRERPWLFRTAANVIRNQRRSHRRTEALVDRLGTTAAPAADTGPDLGDSAIDRALATLSERDREALLLVARDGLTHAEAATVTDCTAATFAVRVHRARRRLAAALGDIAPTTGGATTDEAEEVSGWTT
jgi:RNA polymerase sigma-70 factor (ECF subfamily)